MYLPLEKQKPCVNVLSHWEDRTYRLFNSNMLENIAVLFVCTHTHTHTHTHRRPALILFDYSCSIVIDLI